jgi:hypothetical protein
MKLYWLIAVSLLATGCTLKKIIGKRCDTYGIVRDYSDLDGCGMLIELENGDKLNPVKVQDNFPLTDGLKIRFSYQVIAGMAGICMAEKAFVEITCIEARPEKSASTDNCVDTENPFAIGWMDKAFDRHNPVRIVKYKVKDGFAYLFNGIPNSFLYDCQGKLICQTSGDAHDSCHESYLNHFDKGKIIWQGEGVWD